MRPASRQEAAVRRECRLHELVFGRRAGGPQLRARGQFENLHHLQAGVETGGQPEVAGDGELRARPLAALRCRVHRQPAAAGQFPQREGLRVVIAANGGDQLAPVLGQGQPGAQPGQWHFEQNMLPLQIPQPDPRLLVRSLEVRDPRVREPRTCCAKRGFEHGARRSELSRFLAGREVPHSARPRPNRSFSASHRPSGDTTSKSTELERTHNVAKASLRHCCQRKRHSQPRRSLSPGCGRWRSSSCRARPGGFLNPVRGLRVRRAGGHEVAERLLADAGEIQPHLVQRAAGVILAGGARQHGAAFVHRARGDDVARQRRAPAQAASLRAMPATCRP